MDVDEQFRSKKCVTNNKEYTMKKQGFTLIELMVVIVIMGILAAVAVPKLFGMIAKSKASEIPTAAGSYINMQDAFALERNSLGNWTEVGYSAPGKKSTASKYASENFEYTGADPMGATSGKTANAWKATNKNKLDDCDGKTKVGNWNITIEIGTDANQGNVGYEIGSGNPPECAGLTPAFTNLARAL